MPSRILFSTFLKDVAYLSVTSFGGPQAHLAHFQKRLVTRRSYLSEAELLELNAVCQVLPGPTSTQTLSTVGYKLGGAKLAYLTLLIWILPSLIIMTGTGILVASLDAKQISLTFTRFIQPMAVGFIAYTAYSMGMKTVTTWAGIAIMFAAAIASYLIKTPFVFPITLCVAGVITAFNYKRHPRQEKKKMEIKWANFALWAGVFILAAVIGGLTKALPVRLFENFYRNGSLIFGGGQVLTPLLFTEFVQYAPKQYLSAQEFLSGYALAQAVPGPVFSFSSYIGALAMREHGVGGEILGAIMSAAGIFLPGTFLIFFMIRVWDSLKKFRPIRASLEGILAANVGLVAAAAVVLFQPLPGTLATYGLTIGTFCLQLFTRLPAWSIILAGLLLGLVLGG